MSFRLTRRFRGSDRRATSRGGVPAASLWASRRRLRGARQEHRPRLVAARFDDVRFWPRLFRNSFALQRVTETNSESPFLAHFIGVGGTKLLTRRLCAPLKTLTWSFETPWADSRLSHRNIVGQCSESAQKAADGKNRPELALRAEMHQGLLWRTYWPNENISHGAEFAVAHRSCNEIWARAANLPEYVSHCCKTRPTLTQSAASRVVR